MSCDEDCTDANALIVSAKLVLKSKEQSNDACHREGHKEIVHKEVDLRDDPFIENYVRNARAVVPQSGKSFDERWQCRLGLHIALNKIAAQAVYRCT
jgi:hypothetical protein